MTKRTEIQPGVCIDYTTIPQLKRAGFEGVDVSLDISLLEYGMAWKKSGDEYMFIHRHPHLAEAFTTTSFAADIDWREEFNWIDDKDKDGLLSYYGRTSDEFDELPLPVKIYDLCNYYGVLNIFGESYWEGFYIFEDGRSRVREYNQLQQRIERC